MWGAPISGNEITTWKTNPPISKKKPLNELDQIINSNLTCVFPVSKSDLKGTRKDSTEKYGTNQDHLLREITQALNKSFQKCWHTCEIPWLLSDISKFSNIFYVPIAKAGLSTKKSLCTCTDMVSDLTRDFIWFAVKFLSI
jgi:hypothetical protein